MSGIRYGCVCGHRAHVPGMCAGAGRDLPRVRGKLCTCPAGVPMSQEATWVVRERSAARQRSTPALKVETQGYPSWVYAGFLLVGTLSLLVIGFLLGMNYAKGLL